MPLADPMRVLGCDTCGTVILRGTRYRVGYTTPEALAARSDGDPRAVPGFAPEGSGVAEKMVETVDRLQ